MPGTARKFLREALILLVAMLVVAIALNLYNTRNLAKGLAPVLKAQTIDGMPVDTSRIERPTMIHFWATWCPICALEQGSIDSLADDYDVITVAMQSGDADAIRAFMQEEGLDYPVIADDAGVLAQQWSVRGVPTSFILAPGGEIRFTEVGFTTGAGLRARLWWAGKD